jgi:hypothetical protein
MEVIQMLQCYHSEEQRKDFLIQEILLLGVLKKGELHLFELTLGELEEEYMNLTHSQRGIS